MSIATATRKVASPSRGSAGFFAAPNTAASLAASARSLLDIANSVTGLAQRFANQPGFGSSN